MNRILVQFIELLYLKLLNRKRLGSFTSGLELAWKVSKQLSTAKHFPTFKKPNWSEFW